jgi:predicted ATPase/transcriptional regulator with XRE-family HTH domain
MEATITFGQLVKQRRKALSMTRVELAKLVSCSTVMITKIEGDERQPSIQIARLLARYLKISPKERSTFLNLARPNLSNEQIDEIVSPYSQSLYKSTRLREMKLRTPLTPLIGRAQEVAAICTLLLNPDIRLVTLTGTGGIGKTRLSLQVATELKGQFFHGCWFISLAALEESDLVIPTIARSLGIKEAQAQALDEALMNYLADTDILLVLDNFEQVSAAAEKVADLLAFAPRLKILATSRTVLHLSGEYEFVVPPLKFIDLRNSPPGEELMTSPAMALFVQRAQAVQANFTLNPENIRTVAKICSHLDGLPLAIELAASRIKFLTPAEVLARLEEPSPEGGQLDILAGGARDLPARQKTMRQTIDWSYNLLKEGEQSLFRHLAVFVGGCSPEAATAVCGNMTTDIMPLSLPAPAQHGLADKLGSLVEQSMLWHINTTEGEQRFGMIEALREYALERQVARSKEWRTLRHRHASYFMVLAETAEPSFEGIGQEASLDQLETEHDNLLAALAWCYASEGEAEIGLRLAGALWQFWLIRGYVNEGRVWIARLLERANSVSELTRARALNGAGFLNWVWGDFELAKVLLDEALSIFQELDDKHGTAWVLNHLGHVARSQNKLTLAQDLVEESLSMFRKLGADSNIAWDLLNLGDILQAQNDETQATACFKESRDLFRKVNDHRGMAWVLDRLGQQAHAHHDHEQAITLFTESINIFRRIGDKRSAAWVLNHLGKVALVRGDFQQAELLLEESLALFREISWFWEGAWATLDLGDIAWELGDAAQARLLFNKSLELFNEVGNVRGINDTLERLKRLADIR